MTLRTVLRLLCGGSTPLGRDVRGATAVEYGLIVALIVIAMIASLKGVSAVSINLWAHVSNKVQGAN